MQSILLAISLVPLLSNLAGAGPIAFTTETKLPPPNTKRSPNFLQVTMVPDKDVTLIKERYNGCAPCNDSPGYDCTNCNYSRNPTIELGRYHLYADGIVGFDLKSAWRSLPSDNSVENNAQNSQPFTTLPSYQNDFNTFKKSIASCQLVLPKPLTSIGKKEIGLYITSNDWDESTITWSNKPPVLELIQVLKQADKQNTVDVSKWCTLMDTFGVYLIPHKAMEYIEYPSKKSGAKCIQLQVNVDHGN